MCGLWREWLCCKNRGREGGYKLSRINFALYTDSFIYIKKPFFLLLLIYIFSPHSTYLQPPPRPPSKTHLSPLTHSPTKPINKKSPNPPKIEILFPIVVEKKKKKIDSAIMTVVGYSYRTTEKRKNTNITLFKKKSDLNYSSFNSSLNSSTFLHLYLHLHLQLQTN